MASFPASCPSGFVPLGPAGFPGRFHSQGHLVAAVAVAAAAFVAAAAATTTAVVYS